MTLADNIEMFWPVPSIIAEDGIEHKFSNYYVHSLSGDIWSCFMEDYKHPSYGTGGYRITSLQTDDGYTLNTTHQRVVLAAKLQDWEPLECKEAHHCNGVRDDNRPENLEPRTREEQFDQETRQNQSKAKRGINHYRAKLTEQDVSDIRVGALSAMNIGDYKKQMAEKYNVHHQTVYSIIKGYSWNHVEPLEPLT